jgi:hypothetical protein
MGLGPPVLALCCQLKRPGVFEGIPDVMELGAQNVWCPKAGIVKKLFEAFGMPPPLDMLDGKRAKYISKEKIVAERVEEERHAFHNGLAAARAKALAGISGRALVGELGKRIRRRVVG